MGAEGDADFRDPTSGGDAFFTARVLECVGSTLAGISQAKHQRDLWTVWLYLRDQRLATGEEEVISNAKLGKELGLRRHRIRQMISELKGFVHNCFSQVDQGLDQPSPKPANSPAARRAWMDR